MLASPVTFLARELARETDNSFQAAAREIQNIQDGEPATNAGNENAAAMVSRLSRLLGREYLRESDRENLEVNVERRRKLGQKAVQRANRLCVHDGVTPGRSDRLLRNVGVEFGCWKGLVSEGRCRGDEVCHLEEL